PVHGWLAAKVEVPVVTGWKGMSRPPPETFDDPLGWQSFEVGPNGPVPCTLQGGLPLTSVQVPESPIWQLCGSAWPQLQIGQGRLTVMPRWTTELRWVKSARLPLCRLYVPVTSVAK